MDVVVRDKSGSDRARPDRRRLRGPGGRPGRGDHELQLRGDQRSAAGPVAPADLLAGVETRMAERRTAGLRRRPPPLLRPEPMTSDMFAGRRLITLLFDVSSMQPEDVQRAVDSAQRYVDEQDERGGPRRGRDGQLDARRADRLHRRPRQGRGRARPRSAYTDGHRDRHRDGGDRGDRRSSRGGRTDDVSDRGRRARHVQQRHPSARPQDPRRDAAADRAEEGDPLLQRRHAAQRPGQPGRAALRDQRRGPRPTSPFYAIDTRGLQAVVPGGDARQASGRGNGAVLRPRRRSSSSRSSPRRRTR